MVTLYSDGFWISPYAFACFVALREKGVPFDVSEVHLERGEQRAPAYVDGSWTGRVPALRDRDFWLTESGAILAYLDDRFPAPGHPALLPAEVEPRARARQLMSWLRSDETLAIRGERSAEVIFYDRPRPELTPKATTAIAKTVALASRLVTSEAPMFGDWCIADAELAFFLRRLGHDEGVLPRVLRAYADAQWSRPSVAEYVAHARPPFVPYG
jgi:glutathione S-transferase